MLSATSAPFGSAEPPSSHPPPTGATRCTVRPMRRVGRLCVLAVALVACDGGSAGTSAPPPQLDTKVDVGGYSLALSCRGAGSPTIVLEAGYDSSGLDTWASLLDPMAGISRVCTYDRAGTGVSDPRPKGTITSMSEADELHRLLAGAGIDGPDVVVAHSSGGMVGRRFAAAERAGAGGL